MYSNFISNKITRNIFVGNKTLLQTKTKTKTKTK